MSRNIITPIGEHLHALGIHPDVVTVLGLVCVALAAVVLAIGRLQIAGVILLIALPLDALDGAVARAMQREDSFGAMLDSTLDRYADGFIFAALSYYFAIQDQMSFMLLSQAALIGSLLVSYTRARAAGLGVDCKIGFFTRLERTAVILIMLLIPALLIPGVVLLAVGTNVTALQRLWYVNHSLKNKGD